MSLWLAAKATAECFVHDCVGSWHLHAFADADADAVAVSLCNAHLVGSLPYMSAGCLTMVKPPLLSTLEPYTVMTPSHFHNSRVHPVSAIFATSQAQFTLCLSGNMM